jgi:hypothetical protein
MSQVQGRGDRGRQVFMQSGESGEAVYRKQGGGVRGV